MSDLKLSLPKGILDAVGAATQAIGRPIMRTSSDAWYFPDDSVLISLSFTSLPVKSVGLVRGSADADQTLEATSGSVVYITSGLRLRPAQHRPTVGQAARRRLVKRAGVS